MLFMITEEEFLRFQSLRRRLFDAIESETNEDCHYKSYEGTFRIQFAFKNYFETKDRECAWLEPEEYVIELDCYLFGPGRHYEWRAGSFYQAFKQCKHDIEQWINEDKR